MWFNIEIILSINLIIWDDLKKWVNYNKKESIKVKMSNYK